MRSSHVTVHRPQLICIHNAMSETRLLLAWDVKREFQRTETKIVSLGRKKGQMAWLWSWPIDLWPWKPFQQWPLAWWIDVPISFNDIRPLSTEISRHPKLASCLINAQPLPAHRPAADDNSLIGCTRPRPDKWFVAARCPFCWQPMPISVLVWVRSFIKPNVLKTMYRSTIPLWFIWSSVCSRN